MVHDIVLSWPDLYLYPIMNFHETMGDAIIYNFTVDGFDLTDCLIRGELYDLNTSIKISNHLVGSESAPDIIVTDLLKGKFTATIHTGLTATMQQYSQVEFSIWDRHGNKFTIMQQPVRFTFERIIGQNPLF